MTGRNLTRLLLASLSLLLIVKAGTGIWQSGIEAPRPETISTATLSAERTAMNNVDRISSDTETEIDFLTDFIPEAVAAPAGVKASSASSGQMYDSDILLGLRKQKEALDKREQQLNKQEKLLQQAEEKVKQRIADLEQLQASIKQRLSDEKGIKNKKIKRMTAVFESMKPDRAAPVIANMDLATVVRIFSLMNEKKVGKILSFLPAAKAVSISQALTRQISSVK